ALVLLGLAKDRLFDRNNVPPELPALWVRLGHPERAIAIADDIVENDVRVAALCALTEAFVAQGDLDRAREMVTVLNAIADPDRSDVWRAFAIVGDYDDATEIAGSVARQQDRAFGLAGLAQVMLADGQSERALRTANAAMNACDSLDGCTRASVLCRL